MKLFEFRDKVYKFHDNKDDCGENVIQLAEKAKKYMMDAIMEIDAREFESFRGIDGNNGAMKRDGIKERLSSIIIDFIGTLKVYQNNQIEGMQAFRNFIFEKDPKQVACKINVADIDKNTNFYRMRKAEGYEIFDRSGLCFN